MNYTVLNSIKDVTLPTTGATAAALQNGLLTRFMSLTGTMLFCATLLVAPQQALAWNWGVGDTVTGSGHVLTTSRQLSGFTAINLSIPAGVKLVQSGTEGLTMETDDNISPLIETVVEHGRLVIRLQRGVGSISTNTLRLTVNTRNIEQLDVNGSGNISADKLKTTQLKCNILGSGDLRIGELDTSKLSVSIAGSGDFLASGHAELLEGSIAGSGDLNAQSLLANAVVLSIAGSGDAAVWAVKTLKVRIAGSGDVNYFGDAVLDQSIAGSGSVRHLGGSPVKQKP